MKAYVLHGINDFCLEEVDEPILNDSEVLVAVKAAGICGSDIPRIYTTGTYSYPLIPGHEFSGVVVKVGKDASPAWLGKRVGVFPLIPCQNCGPCQKQQYEMCRDYSYLGSRTNGAFAEFVSVPSWNLIGLPDGVTFGQAAMLEPMAVAVHVMRRANLNRSSSIVICGLGTIGLMLLMFLVDYGCENLFVIGNKDIQKKLAIGMGLTEKRFCDTRKWDVNAWIDKHICAQGAEVFFDCVGSNQVLTWAVSHTAPGGTINLVGNPASDMLLKKDIYWRILRNQLTVHGTWNSSFTHQDNDDWHYVLNRLEQGRVNPEQVITHRLPFRNLEAGLEIMRCKKEEYVKIIGDY